MNISLNNLWRRGREESPGSPTSRNGLRESAKPAKFNRIHFSLYSSEWRTPPELFASLDSIYKFTIDVCATPENALVDRYFTKEVDALSQEWEGVCWMNPPYGRKLIRWIRKAYQESLKGACVVCLIPSRTDTKWFHEYVTKASDVLFIKGRLRFSGATENAPFPSMIVVFGNANPERRIPLKSPNLPDCLEACNG